MKAELEKTYEYLKYLQDHYEAVQRAWSLIVKKGNGKGEFPFLYDDHKFFLLDASIKQHDVSKLSKEEFVPYRVNFFPTEDEDSNSEEVKAEFELAWKHHRENNAHHWQNWVERSKEDGYTDLCVVHMICDWMAMAETKGDTAQSYYERVKDSVKLPPWAVALMHDIFKALDEGEPAKKDDTMLCLRCNKTHVSESKLVPSNYVGYMYHPGADKKCVYYPCPDCGAGMVECRKE